MRCSVIPLLALAACATAEAPPPDAAWSAAMGGPGYDYTTSASGDAFEGQDITIYVGGETIPPGATVELYRGRSPGVGDCVHGELSPQPCLEVTDHTQLLGIATVIEAEPGLWRAEFIMTVPYTDQTVMWLQGVVIDGSTGAVSSPLEVPLLNPGCDPLAMPFGGGSGVEGDPYTICTVEHWQSMEGGGAWFQLASSIDGRGEDLHIDELYAADLDGNGYGIFDYRADRALFGYVDASSTIHDLGIEEFDIVSPGNAATVVTFLEGTLRNIWVEDSYVEGPSSLNWTPGWREFSTGGLVAITGFGAAIEGCEVEEILVSGGNRTGGLVGYASGTTLLEVEVEEAFVEGEASVGGLIGYAEQVTIEVAEVEVDVHGRQCFTGGVIGRCNNDDAELEPYVMGLDVEAVVVGARTDAGGVVGATIGGGWFDISMEDTSVSSNGTRTGGVFGMIDEGTVSGVYINDIEVYGGGRYTGGFAGVDAALEVSDVSIDDAIVEGGSFGTGGMDGLHLNGLIHDVIVSYAIVHSDGAGVGGLVGVNGPQNVPRRGPGVGMPYINEYVPTDIDTVEVMAEVGSSRHGTGGLVGVNMLGDISHATVTSGEVGGVSGDGFDAGGLVGTHIEGSITDSGSEVSVYAGLGPAGGVVGAFAGGGQMLRVWSTSSVEAGEGSAGGVVGAILNGTISQSFAAGDVYIDDGFAGGFVGSVTGFGVTIDNSYATGDVYAGNYLCMEGDGTPVGGFAGTTGDSELHILESYAVNDYVAYGEGSGGNPFLGGVPCGSSADPNEATQNGYYSGRSFANWDGEVAIDGIEFFLNNYPTLSTAVWSETQYNPFSPDFLNLWTAGAPALLWQCGVGGVVCGPPSVP
jgi:hypothetical protein